MRKTRKKLVGKTEDSDRFIREQELQALHRTLHQQWRWQRQLQTTEQFMIAA